MIADCTIEMNSASVLSLTEAALTVLLTEQEKNITKNVTNAKNKTQRNFLGIAKPTYSNDNDMIHNDTEVQQAMFGGIAKQICLRSLRACARFAVNNEIHTIRLGTAEMLALVPPEQL